jgi:hypothetical protein
VRAVLPSCLPAFLPACPPARPPRPAACACCRCPVRSAVGCDHSSRRVTDARCPPAALMMALDDVADPLDARADRAGEDFR